VTVNTNALDFSLSGQVAGMTATSGGQSSKKIGH